MFVLGLEVLKELVEALVPLTHAFDRLVQTFAILRLVGLDELLQLFYFLNCPGTSNVIVDPLLSLTVLEKQHLVLLVFILVGVIDDEVWHLVGAEGPCHGNSSLAEKHICQHF